LSEDSNYKELCEKLEEAAEKEDKSFVKTSIENALYKLKEQFGD
jgi:hypothetical protein